MIRFKCNGEPIFDGRFQEAINKWAKAKGINPEDVFTANLPKYGQYRTENISKLRCKLLLSIVVKGQINTSAFEEAVIIEYKLGL